MDNGRNHLLDVLNMIDNLQKSVTGCEENNDSCTRPLLGINNSLVYNTRPVTFYLADNSLLTVDYGTDSSSSVFRVENVSGNCVTVRILAENVEKAYVTTNEMATINIDCIAAIRCLDDISITLL